MPDSTEIRYQIARIYAEKDLYAQALEEYQKILELEEDFYFADFSLGELYYKNKMYEKARERFEKCKKVAVEKNLLIQIDKYLGEIEKSN